MPPEQQLRRLRFGVFEVDLRAGELRKNGQQIRLQEQPFQVLALLLAHPGEVVTREQARNALWSADTFVDFDHGLNKAVNKIREALGDSAQNPRFVETVARRGYRFLAPVQVIDAAPVADSEPAIAPAEVRASGASASHREVDALASAPSKRSSSRVWKNTGLVLLVLTAALVTWKMHGRNNASPNIRSLAVLPLESLSGDASQDYFADGMTDELISDLGQISALRVISRTSVMAYKHAHKPLPQIARELDVDVVVEGTVLLSGDQVRITAQLIEASADRHLWSQSYDGELRDTLGLQKKVAKAIADQIRINVNPQEQASLKTAKLVNAAAYESYLKGRYFWSKRTTSGLQAALDHFNRAIAEDPKYAEAYSGLADTYALLGDWEYGALASQDALPKAKRAAMRALELDRDLAEAHNSLAFCLDIFEWNFAAAGEEFRRAIELNPSYATAHHWYAWHLSLVGRPSEAIAEMRWAGRVDPLSLIIMAELAELLITSHAYDESIRESQKVLEMDPNFALAHNQLGEAFLQKHMYDDAIAALQKAVQLSGGSPTCTANLARAYVASGHDSEAQVLLHDLESRSLSGAPDDAEIAAIYVALNNVERAMSWLEKGFQGRFNPSVLLRPGFDPLRSNPRFQALLDRIGLPH